MLSGLWLLKRGNTGSWGATNHNDGYLDRAPSHRLGYMETWRHLKHYYYLMSSVSVFVYFTCGCKDEYRWCQLQWKHTGSIYPLWFNSDAFKLLLTFLYISDCSFTTFVLCPFFGYSRSAAERDMFAHSLTKVLAESWQSQRANMFMQTWLVRWLVCWHWEGEGRVCPESCWTLVQLLWPIEKEKENTNELYLQKQVHRTLSELQDFKLSSCCS